MRTAFEFKGHINWFPGHMARSLKNIRGRLAEIDCVIELRDARLPWSSINDTLERYAFRQRKRLIVYNKSDLANLKQLSIIEKQIEEHQGERPLFVNARNTHSLDCVIEALTRLAHSYILNSNTNHHFMAEGFRIIVLGIPNVGKSTIINALRYLSSRKSSVAETSPLPGHTRSLSSWITLSEHPKMYLMDSPGIMLPKIRSPTIGLNLALSGAVKETIVAKHVLADYLLYNLNQRKNDSYLRIYDLPYVSDSIDEVLLGIAKRIGAFAKGGVYDLERAAEHFVKLFRLGKLGRVTLDPMDMEFVKNHFELMTHGG
jgi:ribosome biogenesis GTP-binding protein YlqF